MKRSKQQIGRQSEPADRVTVTLGPGQREFLQAVAERNNTTIAFVMRYVITKFIESHKSDQIPLQFPKD